MSRVTKLILRTVLLLGWEPIIWIGADARRHKHTVTATNAMHLAFGYRRDSIPLP